jgi:hypothetical protein
VRFDCAGALDQLVEASSQGVIAPDKAVVRECLCASTAGHRLLLHPLGVAILSPVDSVGANYLPS